MAWEVTPRLNPWGLVDVILSGGIHSDDCRKGTGAGPVPITSQLVPTESRYVVGRAGLEPATQGL